MGTWRQLKPFLESLSASGTLCVAARRPRGPSWLLRCSIWSTSYTSVQAVLVLLLLALPEGTRKVTLLYFLQVLGFFYLKCAVETAKQTLDRSSQDPQLLTKVLPVGSKACAWKRVNGLGHAGISPLAASGSCLTWHKYRGSAWNPLLTGQIKYFLAFQWK